MSAKHLQYKKTSHFTHLILTLLTGGLWIVIWILCWFMNNSHNSRVDLAYQQNKQNSAEFGQLLAAIAANQPSVNIKIDGREVKVERE